MKKVFYQVGGKNLTFSESYLEIDIETTDNQPFEITFEDGNTVQGVSGERLTYGYSNTYGQLEVTALSSNVSSISLINNVAIDLSVLSTLTALETFTDENSGGSTITGSNNNFNSSVIDRVHIQNSIAIIDGDISVFAGASYLHIQGSQIAVTGDIGVLVGINILRLIGNNIATTGVIGELAGISDLRLQGNNIAATGDIGELVGIDYLRLQGNNIAVSGDIGELAGINNLFLIGNNITTTGDIGELAGIVGLRLDGSNITATGDIGALAGINYLDFNGNQITVTYTTTSWSNVPSNRLFLLGQATGLITTEVDNLFNDLANATTIPSTGDRLIQITGNNAAPSSASLAARNTLIAAGYTITTN